MFSRHVGSKDRNNPQNSGNTKAEYNVLLTVQSKRKRWQKPTGHKIYFIGREERRFSKLRKLCKLHTFSLFFLLLFGFVASKPNLLRKAILSVKTGLQAVGLYTKKS